MTAAELAAFREDIAACNERAADRPCRKVPRRDESTPTDESVNPPALLWERCGRCNATGIVAGANEYDIDRCPDCENGMIEVKAPHKAQPGTVWDIVVRDMHGRDALGLRKYGRPLKPHDGRDTLQDAYEEALDLAVYLRKAMLERDGK